LLRLIGGWIPLGNKPFGEYLGKIIWAVVICIAVNAGWKWITRPTTENSPQQTAGQLCSDYHQEQLNPGFGGCVNMRIIKYYGKDKFIEVKKK